MSLNTFCVEGTLVADPELRTAGSNEVCGFRIAINGFKKTDPTTFMSGTLWGKRGVALANHKRKGDTVQVVGEIATQEWEADGGKRSKVVINAREVHFGRYVEAKAGEPDENAKADDYDFEDIPF